MTADVQGVHVEAPLDPAEMVVLAPDDDTSVPFHATVQDFEVDDPESLLDQAPAVDEEEPEPDEPIGADPPTADDLATTPPSVESRTIGMNIPNEDGENGVVAETGLRSCIEIT